MSLPAFAELKLAAGLGRVLHVITRLDRGGSADNTIVSCLRLAARGWEVSLACGPTVDPSPLLADLRQSGSIRRIDVPSLVRPIRPAKDVRAAAELKKIIARGRFDIVHTHSSKAGLLGRWAARGSAARVVHTPHGHVFDGYFGVPLTQVILAAERKAAAWCDRIVVLTDAGRRDHLDRRVGRAAQFVTIPSGVPLGKVSHALEARASAREALGIAPDAFVVGCVARLEPVKGQIHLVEAIARLAASMPSLTLLLAGDGERREALESHARARGIADRVIFAGAVADPVQALAASDLFALPSLNEGMGRAAVEAMAAGVPVIASAVGGLPEVLDRGNAGLLVPPGDPGALADAIRELAGSPDKRSRLAGAARIRAARYDENVMIDRLDTLYRELLGRPVLEEVHA